MIKTWNGAERFALRAFPAAGRAKEDERPVLHKTRLFRGEWIDVDPPASAIEPHIAVDQREDGVIATQSDIFSG